MPGSSGRVNPGVVPAAGDKRHQRVTAGPVRGDHTRVGDADVRGVEREEQHPRPRVHFAVRRRNGCDEAARLSHAKLECFGGDRKLPLLGRGARQQSQAEHRGCRRTERKP